MSRGPVDRARKAARLVELTQRVGRGEQGCFAELYDMTSPSVYGTALQLLQSSRLATSVTREVYVEVWRLAARYDPSESSVLAWMMSMAHRQSADQVRAVADQPDGEGSRTSASADDEREPDRDAGRARTALSSLSESQRQAVVLACFGQCRQREVAAILGLPVGTVTARIRDGLIGLRNSLGVGA